MKKLETIKKVLKAESLRITQARLAVAEILIKNESEFVSAEDIFSKIQKSKKFDCDLVSVYRVLAKYEELGIVSKGSFFGEAARFKLDICCDDLNHVHHHKHEHYFKCTNCGKIETFEDCYVSNKEKELAKKGYQNLSHHLEIVGLCPNCAA